MDAVLTISFIKFSFNVIGLRRKNKLSQVRQGHEDHDDLEGRFVRGQFLLRIDQILKLSIPS
ncbi:hypothetical protein DCO16_04735 [Polynucleobacter antarcticus]|uniref:Uncharacterized protein n=1 Tax=Polynucleobacter antarcticus TaxID=1743162 RepID=A0A6M9PX72_9BURK|nr:hypothetical protein DCO16_04735 [Polynucleobacter antarcticus]